jgi:hypothetical protein
MDRNDWFVCFVSVDQRGSPAWVEFDNVPTKIFITLGWLERYAHKGGNGYRQTPLKEDCCLLEDSGPARRKDAARLRQKLHRTITSRSLWHVCFQCFKRRLERVHQIIRLESEKFGSVLSQETSLNRPPWNLEISTCNKCLLLPHGKPKSRNRRRRALKNYRCWRGLKSSPLKRHAVVWLKRVPLFPSSA